MAALRRMEPPSYGEWQQHEQFGGGGGGGYGGYGSQTLPSQPGGATPTARAKGKLVPTARDSAPPAPPKQGPAKGGGGAGTPKINGSSPAWWPECTCSNRDWYEQVGAAARARRGSGRGLTGQERSWPFRRPRVDAPFPQPRAKRPLGRPSAPFPRGAASDKMWLWDLGPFGPAQKGIGKPPRRQPPRRHQRRKWMEPHARQ